MTSKTKFLGLVFAFTVVFTSIAPRTARASSAADKITFFEIVGTSFVRINLGTAGISGRPACHAVFFPTSYAFDFTTTKGKAMLSTIQAALLAGKTLSVTGGTTCTTLPSAQVETIQGISITP